MQARNNARTVLSGSLDLFSNEFFRASVSSDGEESGTGNELFAAELSKWALGERGVLRFSNIVHHKSDGAPPDVILHEKVRHSHTRTHTTAYDSTLLHVGAT